MNANALILKNSSILYIRLIVSSITGLIASRLLLETLGVSDFGLFSVVGGIVIMMNFLNTIMTSTTFRFIAFELGKDSNKEGVNEIFNISIIIHISLVFIIVILAETVGTYYINNIFNVPINKVDDALFVFRFSVLATVFIILSIPFQGLITAKENFTIRVSIEIFSSIFSLILIVFLSYYNGNQLRLYAILILIVKLTSSFLYFASCKIKYSSLIVWSPQKDFEKYKEILNFSGWKLFGAFATVGKVQGATLIINSFFGTVLNASFGIANQVNTVVLMFSNNLSQAAIPQITKSYSGGNTNRTKQLTTYISKYSFFLMLIPSIPLLLKTNFILNFWLTEVPIYTDIFIRLMIFNALINSLNSGIPAAIDATGNIKIFQQIISTLVLLGLPVSYILFKWGYPPYFIQVTFIAITIINFFIRLILLKLIINFDVKYLIINSYFKIIFVLFFISPLLLMSRFSVTNLTSFLLLLTFSTFWIIASIIIVGLDKREKKIIKCHFINFFEVKDN